MIRDANLINSLLLEKGKLELETRRLSLELWLEQLNRMLQGCQEGRRELLLRLQNNFKVRQLFLAKVVKVVGHVENGEQKLELIKKCLSGFSELESQWSLAMKKEAPLHTESSMFTARSGDSAVVMHDEGSREVVRSIGLNGSVSSFNAEGGRLAAVMPTGMSEADRNLAFDIVPDGANNRTGSTAPKAVVYGDHSRAVSQVAGTMNVANMELHVTSQELEPRCCSVS